MPTTFALDTKSILCDAILAHGNGNVPKDIHPDYESGPYYADAVIAAHAVLLAAFAEVVEDPTDPSRRSAIARSLNAYAAAYDAIYDHLG